MDESTGAGRGSRSRRGAGASPGMPESGADVRIAELERRLAQLEGEPSLGIAAAG